MALFSGLTCLFRVCPCVTVTTEPTVVRAGRRKTLGTVSPAVRLFGVTRADICAEPCDRAEMLHFGVGGFFREPYDSTKHFCRFMRVG